MRKLLVVLAVVSLAAASCGKKSTVAPKTEGSPSGSKAPVTLSGTVNNHGTKDLTDQGASVSITLEQDNFYFDPTFLKAMPGAAVKVEVENMGTVAHTFTIDSLKVDQTVQPGAKSEVTFNLPSTGVVNFYCRFHHGSGMQGAFYFTEGGSGPVTSPTSSYSYGG